MSASSAVLNVVNDQILYNGAKLELFVPDEYFEDGLAAQKGTIYEVFGYLRAYHYNSESDDRRTARKSLMTYPLRFNTKPADVHAEKLDIGDGEQKYWVMTYYHDDILFMQSDIIQNGNDVLAFVIMLCNGKLDRVEYKKIPRMLQLNKLYNGVSFKLPALYEETIVADYYRDPKDPRIPARFAAATAKEPFYAKGVTQREVVSNISTFAGVTFEDISVMLTKADNNKRNGKEEIISDLEKNSLSLS